jgi:2-dehydropantoate 2-reductase
VAPTDQLLADPRWAALTRELMEEVIAASRAVGKPVAGDFAEKMIARTRTMGPYKASTLLDFEQGKDLELASLFLEPLRQARSAGADVPRLKKLCAVLRALAERQTRHRTSGAARCSAANPTEP